ncbi:MAG TPA: SDR family NAD(P)-dependent oxidoreductase [Thermoanaerobaculia bacterium]|nr:SDR family NAD(P)-dependent oxidoreductase [Thermoanaerobaculia bacterium]
MNQIRGKFALVTGASGGIGGVIANVLAEEGVSLVLTAPHLRALEHTAAGARERGVSVLCIAADLRKPGDIAMLVDRAEIESGGIAILINNAGAEHASSYECIDLERMTGVISLNLIAPMILSRLLLPGMIRRAEGHIVNIASLAGLVGTPYEEAYAASKHGLVGFSRSLRVSLRSDGHRIGVSVICPGMVRGAGMYESATAATGMRAPVIIGSVPVEKVGRAVVRAIVCDEPEIVLNGVPILPLLMMQVLSPRFADRIAAAAGVPEMFKTWAGASVRTKGTFE